MARRCWLLLAVITTFLVTATTADAHPLDQLGQLVIVQLGTNTSQISLTIGGGMLANEMVLRDLAGC